MQPVAVSASNDRTRWTSRLALPCALAAAVLLAVGCSSSLNKPPVDDRGISHPAPGDAAKLLPGAENALKPGYYTVRPGDTMIRIGLESGQNHVLPVDSPDAEHAIASTTANAASFTREAEGDKALPVALTCVTVEAR